MFWTNADRAVRFLRRRRQMRQEDLGRLSGVSRQAISRLERRELNAMPLRVLVAVASALGASVHIEIRWRGERLDRLIDAAHAAIQEAVVRWLASVGWVVRVEVTFNHFGDRGRCDVVAFHPATRIMVIVEIKSRIGDIQETLGRLDVKVRLGATIASELGWPSPARVVGALVVGEGTTARRTVATHRALFAGLAMRGRAALAWLRHPDPETAPTGLLWFVRSPDSHTVGAHGEGRARVPPSAHGA